jgi:transposase
MADRILADMSGDFDQMYARQGRPSIPPEQLLKALLLVSLYSIRSERMLMEQLEYNLLFRWFVGLSMDDRVWDATVYTKNRDRLLKHEVASRVFAGTLNLARQADLLSSEHFTVDGTLLEAWAGQKSFKPKESDGSDGPASGNGSGASGPKGKNPEVDFRGRPRCNDTHASSTDPDCRLYRKSKGAPAVLCHMGHVLMENRSGMVVESRVTEANGTAEREAAVDMLANQPGTKQLTVGADKNYDSREFVAQVRGLKVTPHVAAKAAYSAIDGRTTRHRGYAVSQRARKRVEEIFGWMKTVGGLRKLRHRGNQLVAWTFTFTAAVYNLVRLRNLAFAGG